MKQSRNLLMLLLTFMLIMITAVAQPTTTKVQHGDKIVELKAILKDNTNYVGVRALGEAVGLDVVYMEDINMAAFVSKTTTLEILLGDGGESYLDGKMIGYAPFILENGTTYLPLRWVCEKFGFEVGFVDGIVTVDTKNMGIYDDGAIADSETPTTTPTPETPVTDTPAVVSDTYKNFTDKEYYLDILHKTTYTVWYAVDATREGYDEHFETIVRNLSKRSKELLPYVNGFEYEYACRNLVKKSEAIIKLFETKGASVSTLEELNTLLLLETDYYAELERLGVDSSVDYAITADTESYTNIQ